MRVSSIKLLHADAGYRNAHYLKVTTDEGLVGWSEYYDGFNGSTLADAIQQFGATLIGAAIDPRDVGVLSETLTATTRLAAGGVSQQAIAALENACLDIKAKALGIPVYALFGGPFRTRLPVYWTHCGSFRVAHAKFYEEVVGVPPIRSLDDFRAIGQEARKLGYRAVKTNPVSFAGGQPRMFNGGFRLRPGMLHRNVEPTDLFEIADQMAALRDGIGPDADLMLDVSFSQRPEGYIRIAQAIESSRPTWLELDIHDADALAFIRQKSSVPIASLEGIYGLWAYRPYLERLATDVAIIDVMWNGVWQSARIATLADAHHVNIAPHNPVGDLGTLMSAHLSAAVPNFRILELRVDEAPWCRDYLTHPPEVSGGILTVPDRPGWGSDINEAALSEHPPLR
jgi:L-alanine-DL-glutamate epimerase-like enolase superfamily enzyme